jgi:hypothetical protein
MMRSIKTVMAAGALTTLLLGAVAADAADMRLRCERRSDRSKIDVDGRNVPRGTYLCVVTSGANSASDTKAAVRREVEFDFDSNTNEVGDVPIPADFIQNGRVCATITGPRVFSGCAQCEVR